MTRKSPPSPTLHRATRLAQAGRAYSEHGVVSPATYHASTILFPDVATLKSGKQDYIYGRRGTPTSRALEDAICRIEGGHGTRLCPSGLAACTSVLLAFLSCGDHVLMVDTVYGPTRHFCATILKRLGIETTWYDPLCGERIAHLIQPNTKLIYCESPGSQTMEIQDIPAIAAVAHQAGIPLTIDNTWSAGYLFDAFAHGCDISIQAATKYLVGHSDVMVGSVTCNARTWARYSEAHGTLGLFAGPDDMALTLRGIRTLDVRLERHARSALKIAHWLEKHDCVEQVLCPALPGSPGHDLWQRDFTGASGLFSIVLKPASEKAVAAMLDGLALFGMGYSWGGFESLIIPFVPERTATRWAAAGPCLRLHIGLEDPDDLIADLGNGFERLMKC